MAEGGADGALQRLDRRLAADRVNRVAHLGGALRARAERVPLGEHVIDEVDVMKGRARQIDRALPFEEEENFAEDFFERVDDDEAEAAREDPPPPRSTASVSTSSVPSCRPRIAARLRTMRRWK